MSSIPAIGPANVSAVSSLALAVPAEEPTLASSRGNVAPAKDPRQPALSPDATAMLLTEQNREAESAPSKSRVDLNGWDVRNEVVNFLDLKGANLRGANLVAINLSGLNWLSSDPSGTHLCGAEPGRTFLAAVTARGAGLAIAMTRDAGLGGPDFTNADFIDAPVKPVYVRASSARGAHDRVTGFTKGNVAGAAMMNLSVDSKAYENTVLDGVRLVGSSVGRAGFASIDLISADLGIVLSAQFPGFALNNMLGLNPKGYDFLGQFLWFPAERRRRAARLRRRREPASHRSRRPGFEDAFF